ncbi:hypothetical protein G6F26_013885 [Rhizopus arrhizus]|nr:hypothetical protein G6F19_013899 [Rhizopus arrhizus]KAG0807666.1 hypothetical protein G6F18_013886 [Rhizopus arrhizus]KAG0834706.1 hypothetical protein G6F17_013946 [Rhizopus arrhizus]KAG0928451.1 hypothetical protein G6F31_017719 [Rhizopus arrhizus]KAG1006483.1 hypothetical protein G6F26_013885 [Rhizopus arrhizus]
MNNINNIKIACTCTECSMHPGGFRRLAKRTVLTHKRLDKFRGRESRRQTAVPENESVHTTFEDHMNVDGEEELSHEEQLKHLLVLYVVLFQAKHLSVQAGEELLAFLSFFVRALGHDMEIPTKISTARVMVVVNIVIFYMISVVLK